MERYKGFEPSPTAWKAVMLPLHQYRIGDRRGVEPLLLTLPKKMPPGQPYKWKFRVKVATLLINSTLVTRIGFEPNINRLRIYYPKPLDERAECVRTLRKTIHKEYYLPQLD